MRRISTNLFQAFIEQAETAFRLKITSRPGVRSASVHKSPFLTRRAFSRAHAPEQNICLQILRRLSAPQNDISGASCRATAGSAGIRTSGKPVRLQQDLLLSCNNQRHNVCSVRRVGPLALLAMTLRFVILCTAKNLCCSHDRFFVTLFLRMTFLIVNCFVHCVQHLHRSCF